MCHKFLLYEFTIIIVTAVYSTLYIMCNLHSDSQKEADRSWNNRLFSSCDWQTAN